MDKKPIILVSVLILMFLSGFAGYSIANKNKTETKGVANKEDARQGSFEDGWNAARERLIDSGFYYLKNDVEIKSVSGLVKEINENGITVKINRFDPLSDEKLDERIIKINEDTKFFRRVDKDQDLFQEEMAEFQKKINGSKVVSGIEAPLPFEKKAVSRESIKADQQVEVVADGNIKELKEFIATEIIIQFDPSIAMGR